MYWQTKKCGHFLVGCRQLRFGYWLNFPLLVRRKPLSQLKSFSLRRKRQIPNAWTAFKKKEHSYQTMLHAWNFMDLGFFLSIITMVLFFLRAFSFVCYYRRTPINILHYVIYGRICLILLFSCMQHVCEASHPDN